MSDADEHDDGDAVHGQRFRKLPEMIAAEDMSTSRAADAPPPLPNSDYDRQERFLREAAG